MAPTDTPRTGPGVPDDERVPGATDPVDATAPGTAASAAAEEPATTRPGDASTDAAPAAAAAAASDDTTAAQSGTAGGAAAQGGTDRPGDDAGTTEDAETATAGPVDTGTLPDDDADALPGEQAPASTTTDGTDGTDGTDDGEPAEVGSATAGQEPAGGSPAGDVPAEPADGAGEPTDADQEPGADTVAPAPAAHDSDVLDVEPPVEETVEEAGPGAGDPTTHERSVDEPGAADHEAPGDPGTDDAAGEGAGSRPVPGTDGAAVGPDEAGAPHDETSGASPTGAAAPAATPALGRHGAATPEPGGLRGLGRALRPRASRAQVVVGILCALLGFALVAQVSQTQEGQLSSLRQDDLVRLLDDVTQRSGELEDQVASLEATRDELQSGSGRQRAALEVARQQEQTQGILSGRLPAEGPGVEIEVVEGGTPLDAFSQFNVLEELRNAGAEAMEVNGVRLVASSYFEDAADGVVVDGTTISSPYRWTVIGDPSTLETALEIPGGAMASLRGDGARTTISQEDRVEVSTTREPTEPQYATPVPADE